MMSSRATISTLLSLSDCCTSISQLKQIHGHLIRRHLATTLILAKLLRFAAVSPSGDLRYATLLFSYHHPLTTTSSPFFYNTLIRGLSKTPSPLHLRLSLSLFSSMRRRSVPPDPFSFTFLLKSSSRCAAASGENIHSLALKSGCLHSHPSHLDTHNALIHFYASRSLPDSARKVLDEMPLSFPDVISWSGLLTAYVKANDLDTARRVFDSMPVDWDVVSWTAMISGYARARRPRDALALFESMPVLPDEVTMVGVISACTALGDLETGERVRRYVEEKGFGWMVSLRNALIDMYSKCGCLLRARRVFDGTTNKSLISWNCMISAYAMHGDADGAIALFRQMEGGGVRPDGATQLAVLTACVHGGRVEEGRRLFEEMRRDGVGVGVEHYGCMVDMLGRSGRLEEAYGLIEGMPMPSNDAVWGALLGACRIHGDVEMAERAVRRLMELKPDEGGYYILLSGIYADAGRREEAAEVRQAMKLRRANKTPGSSISWGEEALLPLPAPSQADDLLLLLHYRTRNHI